MSMTIDPSAVKRIEDLRIEKSTPNLRLRITVDSGGCSGFQYLRELTEIKNDDDLIFEDVIITDPMSIPFLKDSVVAFKTSLVGSDFVIENPNAASGCGCGTSFSL